MQPMHGNVGADSAGRLSIPLAVLVVGFVLMVGFQTVQLIRERGNLFEIQLAQEPTVQEGAKLRQQLDSLPARQRRSPMPAIPAPRP
jgi:hypothetical protein